MALFRRPKEFQCGRLGVAQVVIFAALILKFALVPVRAEIYADLDPERLAEIFEILPESPQGVAAPCSDRATWTQAKLTVQLQPIMWRAQSLTRTKYPAWSDEKYLEFSKSGERTRSDAMMSARRSWLMPLVLAECIEYRGRFLPYVEMVVGELLRQKTWVLSASDPTLEVFRGRKQFVELYSAELAKELADALYLLRDRINPVLRSEALSVLDARIFRPFRDALRVGKGLWWLRGENNWNAVCLNGVTAAALTILPERHDRALFAAAAEHYSKNYISGFREDGYAVEGLAYWNYGFSRFVELRERLWRATNGRVDLFANSKVRNIALYGPRFLMFSGNAAAFGDSVLGTKPDPTVLAYIRDTLDPCVSLPQEVSSTKVFLLFPRDRAYPKSQCDGRQSVQRRHYFENAGVLVSRPGGSSQSHLAVTIKGDGNGPHSHNDIGSYAIALGNQQPVGDPGGLRHYSKRSFGAHRYESKVLNSYGHPVPVVAGQLQVDATKVKPKVLSTSFSEKSDEIVIDMAPAYAVRDLKSLNRRMQYDRHGLGRVMIEDVFEFGTPEDFEVALTTHRKWRRLNENTLVFDADGKELQATIEASAAIDIRGEKIAENGISFERISIRMKQPRLSGTVRVLYQEAK